jgi:transcriptional regulator with PAS, ATPase and Fis domain
VTIPPLRARRGDISTLAKHFYADMGGPGSLSPDFLAMLAARSWPGNVRELRSFIERSVSLGLIDDGVSHVAEPLPDLGIPADVLERLVPVHAPLKEARQAWTESFETVYVRCMLRRTGGNLTRAAELAGVNRRFMQRIVSRLASRETGVDPSDLEDE